MKSISLTLLATLNDDKNYSSKQLLDSISGVRAQQAESSEIIVTDEPTFITTSCQAIIIVGDGNFYIRYDNALTKGLVNGPTTFFSTSGTLSNIQMYAPTGDTVNAKIILASGPAVYAPVSTPGFATYIDLANQKTDIENEIKSDLNSYALTTALTKAQDDLTALINQEIADRKAAITDQANEDAAEYATKHEVTDAINGIPKPDMSQYAKITYVDGQISDVKTLIESEIKKVDGSIVDGNMEIVKAIDKLIGEDIPAELNRVDSEIIAGNMEIVNALNNLSGVDGNASNGSNGNNGGNGSTVNVDLSNYPTKNDLNDETLARQLADNNLQEMIGQEIKDRQNAIASIPKPDMSNYPTNADLTKALDNAQSTVDDKIKVGNDKVTLALREALDKLPLPNNGGNNNGDTGTLSLADEVAAREKAIANLQSQIAKAIADAKASATPSHFPQPCPSGTIPDGWLVCDGKTFDTSKYPKLGAAFPSGSLPDMRGVFLRGYDPAGVYDPDGPTRKVGTDIQKGSLQVFGGISGDMVSFSGPATSLEALQLDKLPDGFRNINPYWTGPGSEIISTNNNMGRTRPYNIAVNWVVRAA